MKKIVILLAIVAIVFVAAMPYVTGRIAEDITLQMASQMNTSGNGYGQLDVSSYQRGYNSTQSSFKWSAAAAIGVVLEYDCEGQHGLLKYSYQCKAKNIPDYTEFVNKELGGIDPLSLEGNVSIFGAATQTIKLNAFEVKEEGGDVLSVLPGSLDINTDKDFDIFDLHGEFAGLNVSGADGDFSVSGIDLKGALRINHHKFAIGDIVVSLNDFTAKSQSSGGDLKLNGLSLTGFAEEQGENMRVGYKFSMDEFVQSQLPDQSSDVDVKNIAVDFQIDGIDMAQFALISEEFQSISALPEEDYNAAMLAMWPDLEGLLKPGLKIATTVSAIYLSEPFNAEVDVELLDKLALGDFMLVAVDPSSLFSKFKAKLSNRLPKVMVASSPQAEAMLANSPLYVETDKSYDSRIDLLDNEVTMNGDKMNIEELLAMLTQAMM